MSLRLKTVTLGCKVNQYETELVREGFLRGGYVEASEEQQADLCVVNTCTVTAEGDSKSRQLIRRLARGNPGARIVVMGCYATRAPQELARLPGVFEVVTDKRELPDLLGRFGVGPLPAGVVGMGGRHRAYVKVQDGCLLRCSFCIIPKVRPNMYSRPADGVLEEIGQLVDRGYREIVLTGIHLGHYGVDFNRRLPKQQWTRLSHLVRRIASLPGKFRVRLSSIEATEVTRELIDVMVDHPDRVCPHLHISMQSGSDSVLRRMRRRWGSRRFVDRCRLVQQKVRQAAITTDVIVGFPGETDEDFAATCDVAEEVGFSKIHIFPFSPRDGTPAADMPDQVPAQVKRQRARQLAELEARQRTKYFRSLLGRRLTVLLEGPNRGSEGLLSGTSCRYAPVDVPVENLSAGELVDVRAVGLVGDRLQGQLIER